MVYVLEIYQFPQKNDRLYEAVSIRGGSFTRDTFSGHCNKANNHPFQKLVMRVPVLIKKTQ